jgi:VWFA-related protein
VFTVRILPLIAAALLLQGQTEPVFRVPVRIVEVPVVVTDEAGKMIRDLAPDDFTLFDNGRTQRFQLDEAGQAFSVAIAVQNSENVRAWLPEVTASAAAIEALLVGAMGEAAVVTFSDEVLLRQDMTADVARLDRAFRALTVSGDGIRTLDAIQEAARILGTAPENRRRILLLIGQSSDSGSKARLADVTTAIERLNIAVYCLKMPRIGKDLLGSVRVSGLSSQGGRDTGFIVMADLTKIVPEIYRSSKAAAGEDAVTVLTSYTGGRTIPFRRRNDLDAAISSIGEELHTGYVLTCTPDDHAPGYHAIRVAVVRSGVEVRARPGYFVSTPEHDMKEEAALSKPLRTRGDSRVA